VSVRSAVAVAVAPFVPLAVSVLCAPFVCGAFGGSVSVAVFLAPYAYIYGYAPSL
jgi:hypothetical protein